MSEDVQFSHKRETGGEILSDAEKTLLHPSLTATQNNASTQEESGDLKHSQIAREAERGCLGTNLRLHNLKASNQEIDGKLTRNTPVLTNDKNAA